MNMMRSVVVGCGAFLPSKCVTNDDLTHIVDTSDAWIVQRTGIRYRYVVDEKETTADLATYSAQRALEHASLSPQEVDMIILATSTPNHTFPATATEVHRRLGLKNGMAFDIQAVCCGFLFALSVADNFLRVGQVKTALVIGAETFSRLLDWKDRNTCVLFGDGAGAVVLQAQKTKGLAKERGILSTHLQSNGDHYNLLWVDGGPSTTRTTGYLRMSGKELFRYAIKFLTESSQKALQANNLQPHDIDWFVPHQANLRLIKSIAHNLEIPFERVIVTVDQHGNTSSASIPLALNQGIADGRLKQGDLVLIGAIGGGLSWGSTIIRW